MPDPGIYKQVRWSRSDLIPSYNVYLDSDGVERRSKTWISTNEVWSEPPIAVKTDTKVSFKTPDYRTRRRKRLPLPDNYFHRSGVTVASGVMSASYLNPTTGAQSSWRCSVSPFITVGILPIGDTVAVCQRAESAAIFDVQSKSRGHQWNAPVFIAEAGKTAEMVYNRAHHLTTLARHLLRGNFVGFARNLASELPSRKYSRGIRRFNREYQKDPTKAAANAWLEYTYGWTPFMSDVRNAANVLFDVVHNEPMRVYVSVGRGNSREVIDHVNNNTTFLGYGVRTSWRETREVSSKVVWRYQIAPWSLPNQIGLDNPALVAWELVPFSFVADWFLPIGDYISQLSLNPAVSHVGGVKIRYGVNTIDRFSISSRTSGFSVSSTFSSVTRGLDRIPLTGAPYVELESLGALISTDGLADKWRRQISSVALLRQQMTRFRR